MKEGITIDEAIARIKRLQDYMKAELDEIERLMKLSGIKVKLER